MEKIAKTIAQELGIKESQVEATVKLIDEGNTIPFIARYRKEVTGGLSDETLRDLGERLSYLRNLANTEQNCVISSVLATSSIPISIFFPLLTRMLSNCSS